MLLALGATAIVAAALAWELALVRLRVSPAGVGRALARRGALLRERLRIDRSRIGQQVVYDPGRELRAEQRARELLRSCVNAEEWAMYRDLGFLRVLAPTAGFGSVPPPAGGHPERDGARAPYAYLLYPHRPIVAYVPQTGALLNEYCVAFPDEVHPAEAGGRSPAAEAGRHSPPASIPRSASIPASGSPAPPGGVRLPDADDVLAKWMALVADERRLIAEANMHLPGRQLDPEQVRGDLARLARWERERASDRRSAGVAPAVGAVSTR
jgi:hypothetical protein